MLYSPSTDIALRQPLSLPNGTRETLALDEEDHREKGRQDLLALAAFAGLDRRFVRMQRWRQQRQLPYQGAATEYSLGRRQQSRGSQQPGIGPVRRDRSGGRRSERREPVAARRAQWRGGWQRRDLLVSDR